MAERRWTDEQLSAINTRDKTLLVSAAAGSGKTATLTERIIRQLTDPTSRVDITSLLIVTFTNAAAAELRAKVSAALEAAVIARPEDKALARQLYLLPAAEISTIDSFCNELVRKNADRVGLMPGYRIADEAELMLLEQSVLDGLIDALYAGELPSVAAPDAFDELCDCLTDSKRTEDLADVLRRIYGKCATAEDGIGSLLPLIEEYNPNKFVSVEKTKHGAYLMERVRELCHHYRTELSGLLLRVPSAAAEHKKFKDVIGLDIDSLLKIEECDTYEKMRERVSGLTFKTKPAVSDDPTGAVEETTMLRDLMKKDIKSYLDYFKFDTEHWRLTFTGFYRVFTVLYNVLAFHDRLYREEKRRRGIVSYNDIERYAYEILWQNGERTDIALAERERYSAVYIDEYQDVNSLQNKIFEALSLPNNRFMVGDIKQSIYGFRSARPEIFAALKAEYPPLAEATGDTAAVFMSNNFRCDEAIVDFVNSVFDKIFTLTRESIDYEEGDRLRFAKAEKVAEEYIRPSVCMLRKGGAEIDGVVLSEPQLVAMKIKELLASARLNDGSPVSPSDIVIIMRSMKQSAEYAAALAEVGVPSVISDKKSFFLSREVLLALCLLNAIDNPRRDVYLAGLMCSPLYSFTPDDLYLIRRAGGETLYEDLVSYTQANPDFKKGEEFLNSLAHYRAIAEGVGIDKLLYRLYSETGLLATAAHSGGKDNLMLLYDWARTFAAGSYKGLYSFLTFINSIVGERTTFDDSRESGETDAVEIITCHKSKGLEYPIVFLAECGAQFRNHDAGERLAFAEDFGISVRLRTPSGLALVNNPVQGIVNDYIYEKDYEEELRVLYVAITRARERLFITGECPRKSLVDYKSHTDLLRKTLSPYSARQLSSYLEILLAAGDERALVSESAFLAEAPTHATALPVSEKNEEKGEVEAPLSADEYFRRFTYVYPDTAMVDLPEKMSVSEMSPTVLDGTEEPSLSYDSGAVPAFISGSSARESARRGIATHYFMQFCDLENLKSAGVDAEIERLATEKFISRADAERIRRDEIAAFVRSSLFEDMREAKGLWRELRFNVRLPAVLFTEEEKRGEALSDKELLVQGVIDCIIEYPDGKIGVFDYKTDRLTREELASPTLAEEKMRAAHEEQLYYYSLAVEKMFGKSPSRVEVYSLALGDTVNVKKDLQK